MSTPVKVLIGLAIITLPIILFVFFSDTIKSDSSIDVDSSYNKVMSSLNNRNWSALNYNYEKALDEIKTESLELNFDQKKKLEMAYTLSEKLNGYDKLEKKYNSVSQKDRAFYSKFYQEISALPDLESMPKNLDIYGFNEDKIYGPARSFYNKCNVDFLEVLIPNDLISKVKNGELIITQDYLNTTYINLSKYVKSITKRIKTNNPSLLKQVKRVNKDLVLLKSTAIEIIERNSQAIEEQEDQNEYREGDPIEPAAKTFTITVDNLRVRTSPELDSDKIENLPINTEVEFIEKSTKETTVTIRGKQITAPWYKVKTPSGNIGWIHGCCFSGL